MGILGVDAGFKRIAYDVRRDDQLVMEFWSDRWAPE